MSLDPKRVERWSSLVGFMLLAFVLGGIAGYVIRPYLDEPAAAEPAPPAATPPTGVAAATGPQAGPPSDMMAAVIGQTRHWKGDPKAPVTIVEFGDFQ